MPIGSSRSIRLSHIFQVANTIRRVEATGRSSSTINPQCAPRRNKEMNMKLSRLTAATCLLGTLTLAPAFAHAQTATDKDKQFLKDTAEDSNYEIKTGQLALQKSSSADVKQYATMIIHDHTQRPHQGQRRKRRGRQIRGRRNYRSRHKAPRRAPGRPRHQAHRKGQPTRPGPRRRCKPVTPPHSAPPSSPTTPKPPPSSRHPPPRLPKSDDNGV